MDLHQLLGFSIGNIFCLSKRWLFLICDIILDYREALVFYRIFSTLVINFFEFLKFGSKSIEKSIDNVYQSTSVTVNFTDNRDYRAILYSMGYTGHFTVDLSNTNLEHLIQLMHPGSLFSACSKGKG